MIICSKCGNELEDDMIFCNKCGNELKKEESNADNKQEEKNNKSRLRIADVINEKNVGKSTNKVAAIANKWALSVRNRGTVFAVIAFLICFCPGVAMISDSYGESSEGMLIILGGFIAVFIITAIFNTIAFIIRMGAEIIQLLDDIKNKQ